MKERSISVKSHHNPIRIDIEKTSYLSFFNASRNILRIGQSSSNMARGLVVALRDPPGAKVVSTLLGKKKTGLMSGRESTFCRYYQQDG
jgi:hypothetical protein